MPEILLWDEKSHFQRNGCSCCKRCWVWKLQELVSKGSCYRHWFLKGFGDSVVVGSLKKRQDCLLPSPPRFSQAHSQQGWPLSFSSAWVETHYCPTLTLELTALAVAYTPQATPGRFCSLHVSSGRFPSIKEEAGTTPQPQESLHEKKVTAGDVPTYYPYLGA